MTERCSERDRRSRCGHGWKGACIARNRVQYERGGQVTANLWMSVHALYSVCERSPSMISHAVMIEHEHEL